MPLGFLTEDGPRPEFAELYGTMEVPRGGYPERTLANVRDSDATIWFDNPDRPGARTTLRACTGFGKSIAPQDRGEWAGAWLTSGSIRRELFQTCRPHMVSMAAEKIKERICV